MSCNEIRQPIVPISYRKLNFLVVDKGIIQARVSFQPCFFSLTYQGDLAPLFPVVDTVAKLAFRD